MQKIIYAVPPIFVLLTGFSSSSLSYNAFAQNYLDVSTSVNSLYADQITSEEKRKQQARDKLAEKRSELQEKAREKRSEVRDTVQDRKEAIKDRIKEKRDEVRDNVSDRRDEIKSNVLEKRSDLKEKFQNKKDELITDLKQKAKEKRSEVKERVQEKRSEIKDRIQEKRDVYLELLRLGDSGATLKIIGGQIVIEDPVTGELYNVHDVSFGRSRANFDNDSLQVVINTVDFDGQPHTFVMQTSMDGIFPTTLGGAIDIDATDGKSKSGTEWILDFVGTLTVDDPITMLADVEALSEVDEIVEESIDDCYALTLSDFYTDVELEELYEEFSDEDLVEFEEDLLTDICSELGDEVEDDILNGLA